MINKNKKAIFGIIGIIYALLIITILILMIWFGLRISEGLTAVFTFLTTWWWAIALLIGLFFTREFWMPILLALRRRLFRI